MPTSDDRFQHFPRSRWPTPHYEPVAERERYKPRTYVVQLDCRHTLLFPTPLPEPGASIFCRRCNRNSHVNKESS